MQANTIEEVIQELDNIINKAETDNSRLGYFAALYRKVTVEIKKGIEDDVFEDGPRMERFDVIFANRYLKAYEQHQKGEHPSECWALAFAATSSWRPLVSQHLLLGINAHINLDLGIAAAQTSPGDELPALENDFNTINDILGRLVGVVESDLAEVWPMFGIVIRALCGLDKKLIRFSMDKARQFAWDFAVRLAPLDQAAQQKEIDDVDPKVQLLGIVIWHPGVILSTINLMIRLCERGSVAQIIGYLK